MNGYSIVLIPRDWQLGSWHKPNSYGIKKSIYAFGPFRFVVHRDLGALKPDAPSEPSINRGEREGFNGGARSGELGFDG